MALDTVWIQQINILSNDHLIFDHLQFHVDQKITPIRDIVIAKTI